VSGKAGLVFRAAETGNIYVSYGTTVTPPGTANFTLSAQVNNQNNPSVKPQESANFEVGSKWDLFGTRVSLTGAAFRTLNKNVIFTVDAAAMPPVYNQDDRQLVKGVTGGIAGQVTERWNVLFSAGSYLRMDCSLRFVTRMYGGDAGRKLRRDSLPRVDLSQTSTRSGSARTSTQGRSSPLTTGR